MLSFISVVIMIISILLALVVLLQPGKGDMLTGLSGLTGQFSSVFGTRRTMDLLSNLTIGLAIAVMVLSLVANMFFVGGEAEAPKPITEGVEVPAAPQQPLQDQPLPPPPAPSQDQKQNEE